MGDISRRKFVSTVAGAGAAMTIVPRHVLGHGIQAPSDTVNIAVVGFGMGASNAQALMSQNLVAFCDVQDSIMAAAIKRFENAANALADRGAARRRHRRSGRSRRRRSRKPTRAGRRRTAARTPSGSSSRTCRSSRSIATTARCSRSRRTSTPSSSPRPITCTRRSPRWRWISASTSTCRSRSAGRSRRRASSRKKAKDRKVVSQMGNQGHSTDDARTGYEYIASGAIGEIREVHVWTNRPLGYWPQGVPRPQARSPSRSEPAARLEWPRTSTAARRRPRRQLSQAGRSRLEPVPRRCAGSRVPPDLSPVQLARLGGLGPGRARRHGRAPGRPSVLGAEPRLSDDRRNAVHAVQRRDVPVGDDDLLRVPEARQPAAGEADLVRRRPAAAEARRPRRRADEPGRRPDVRRHQGQAGAGHLRRSQPRLYPVAACGVEDPAAAEAEADRPRRARDELGRGDQGPGRDLVAVRIRRAADRSHAARHRRAPRRPEDPLRRREHEDHQLGGVERSAARRRAAAPPASTGRGSGSPTRRRCNAVAVRGFAGSRVRQGSVGFGGPELANRRLEPRTRTPNREPANPRTPISTPKNPEPLSRS